MIGAVLLGILVGFLVGRVLLRHLRVRRARLRQAMPGRAGTPAPAVTGHRPSAATRDDLVEVSRRGQLVFVVPLGDGMLGLDCLLEMADDSDATEFPVHLVTALPASPWLAEVEQNLVVRWLTTGYAVDVELSLVASLPRVTLTCDKTTLMLPLTTA